MKSWVKDRRLAGGIFALVLIGLSANVFAAVGRTVGTYQVSATGAATYTIPIWAPRGPNGLGPRISLVYDSQSGGGYLGVGWSLSGLSSIYRCTQTYAQDPAAAPVTLTLSDVFCRDGRRLRLTGGTYGVTGSTYQTEVADFSNVTAYGTAGNGPAYFEVQGRDGLTYEYGNGGGSQVLANGSTASVWWLDKVTDRAGNTMTISYDTATGSAVPSTISWTPSSYGASTYNYTMQFAYGTNTPQSSTYGYLAGTEVVDTHLLESITIDYAGSTVKHYALTYQQSPTTGRDELTQVQECADAGATNCLAPTTVAYQSGAAGVSSSALTALPSGSYVELYVNYDFDGNGYRDLAYCNGGSPNLIYVAFGSPGGYGTPVNTGITCAAPLYGDLLGTGRDGILANSGGTWTYYTWNGSSFVGTSTGLAYDSTAAQYVLADVNGDGLPDLVASYITVNRFGRVSFHIYTRLNASSGSTPAFSTSQTLAYSYGSSTLASVQLESSSEYAPPRRFDFNGDGRDDLALQTIEGGSGSYTVYTYELISTGTAFTATQISNSPGSAFVPVSFLDFNSDRCTDYLANNTIYVSGCNGSVPTTISLGSATVLGAMDWDGDGRTDVLVQNGGSIGVYLSTGNGLSALVSTSIPYSASNVYLTLDGNGDGLDDLGVWGENGSSSNVVYYLHDGPGQPPDLLSSVTDGYGNFAKPAYSSIVQGAYSEGTDATYPDENYIGPLYAVNQTIFSDPSSSSGATYQQSVNYYKAWMNLQGRGFEGFEATRTYDSRTGAYDYWYRNPAFPYTGMPTAEYYNLPTATTRYIQNTLAVTTLDSTANDERYFPYISNTTTQHRELGGLENGDLIDTVSTSYGFDNYGNATQIVTTTTDNDPGSPYVGDSWTKTVTNTPDVNTNTWCLGLSSELQVSYSASDGSPSVTRTRQYTPDTTNCRYSQLVTEPSSSSYEVTEALGYDSFGNINSDTITGIGMAAQQTAANWGTTGQFPISVTDATGAARQFNYNLSYGLVSSETDPNGLTTSWTYGDGFGRVTLETRPDGTYTVWQYNSCVNVNGCLFGSDTTAISHYSYSPSGSLETDGTTTYDQVDRPYTSNELLMGGSTWNRIDTRYDSLGRVAQRSMPCIWSTMANPCPYNASYAYDLLNRITEVQRPINQNDSTLEATSYAYAGRTTTITDPDGHARTLIDDVNGWPRRTEDALGYAVALGYDAAGAKTSMSDNLGNTLWTGTYAYGIAPFLVGESDMDRGTWGYTVDALGEHTAWTDPKGQHFYESYDALSRPVTRTEPDLFTQWTWGSSAANHNVGRLQSVCTGTGSACSSSYYSENESYDGLGRLYQRAIAIPSMGTYTYTWQYDGTTGFLDTLTYPVGTSGQALKLKYAYQGMFLQSITDVLDSPTVTIWQADAQNAAGQITQETLGNGLVTNRAYDAVTQWLSSVQSGPGGGASIQNQSFLYDEVGNVTQRQDNNLGLTENFYYDNDNRLSYSTLNGTQNLSLNYNSMGNISSRSDLAGGATWTYDPVHLHQVTQAGSGAYQYVYDANGNVTSRQGSSITWSSYNYPTTIGDNPTGESVSFIRGPDRRAWFEQTQSSSGTETTYHIGGLMDIVMAGGSTTDRDFIYAGSEPIAVDVPGSGAAGFHYFQTDQEGSISAITNSGAQVSVNESFAAFGARRNPATWAGLPTAAQLATIAGLTHRGYTFQEALGSQMGLNDMVGRVQDAITGRFLSADPMIADPSDAQSYNPYSYTINNPLTYTDPTGMQTVKPTPIDYELPVVGNLPPVAVDATRILSPPLSLQPVQIGGTPGTGDYGRAGAGKATAPGTTQPKAPSKPAGQQTNPPNPCQSAGGAPSPQTFADDGRTLASQPPNLLNGLDELSFLLEFRRGGMLDAQNGGQPGGSNAAYANYAFGAFFSGLGWSSTYALQAANAYGSVNSTYPANMLKGSDPNFPAIPPANVTNITKGYNAAAAGALCHPSTTK